MSMDEPGPPEERFTSLLADCDEALRAGDTPRFADGSDVSPEQRHELEADLACAQLLRRVMAPAPPSSSAPPSNLGRFAIRRELGRGTFGIVYLAYDPHLNREVALKVPRGDAVSDPTLLERFQREARAAAGLDHPHIVPVYEAGAIGPVYYIASAYCPGPTLAQWLRQRDRPVPAREAAALVATLAEAVQHAHGRGVLHRDIKPHNVLLVPASRAENGLPIVPRLTDFGLARLRESLPAPDGVACQTAEGAVVGSPAYLSPEQASGQTARIGPHTDVFGLGAVLYELLTGRPPYESRQPTALLEEARQGHILSPRQRNPTVPRALDRICRKALATEPEQRYPSAAALQQALSGFLNRRRRYALVAGAAFLGVLLLTAATSLYHALTRPAAFTVVPAAVVPLSGELIVRIWTDDPDGKRGLRVEEPGALPVVNGEMVHLHARLDEPAYVYLVWVGATGKVQPLYPWNPGTWELPPEQSAARAVHSPPELNRGWRMKGGSGLETALLLARSTPLPADTDLAQLIALPPGKLSNPREVSWLEHGGGLLAARLVKTVHRDLDLEQSARIEEPVLELMERLRPHFDLMKVVRFAHQGE